MQYTKEELKKYWPAHCLECGWKGLSRDCAGGDAMADTGDFSEVICPECIKKELWSIVDDDDSYEVA